MHCLFIHLLEQVARVQAADEAWVQLIPCTHCFATILSPPSLAAPDTDKMIELQLFLDVQEFGRQAKQVGSSAVSLSVDWSPCLVGLLLCCMLACKRVWVLSCSHHLLLLHSSSEAHVCSLQLVRRLAWTLRRWTATASYGGWWHPRTRPIPLRSDSLGPRRCLVLGSFRRLYCCECKHVDMHSIRFG